MKESLPVDLFNALDMVVMERQTDGSFQLKGTALDWFMRFCPESAACGDGLEPGKRSAFLEDFLIDAEEFWQKNLSGPLRSGIWIETDLSGSDCAFEAMAVSLGEKKILLIKLCWMTYTEKQHIIQKGRELSLEYHRITRLEEALQRAQVDLQGRIKRRTEKLFKANELLKQEIVERERMEKALRESTETLGAILAASPVGIGLVRDQTLDWANKALYDLLDCREGPLSDTEARDFFSSREDWRSAVREMIAGIERIGIGRVEANLLTPTGRELCCFLQGSPLDPRDLSRGIILAMLDITERKRAEEEKGKLEADLHQAQKMEAIGLLAGGIAHDFNNILAAIMGFTELSMLKISEDSPLRGNLEQVLKAVARASELVKQILTFTRQGARERQPVRIAPIVRETLMLLRSSLPSTIEIRQEVAVSPGEDVVLADPGQIHQVLMNLSTNAGHSMRAKGGILGVKLSVIADASQLSAYPDLKAGPHVCITVSDTGHGIDSAVLERIFDPYFTTKGPGEGTGLGLSVVQGIVKSHGGSIAVRSEPGRGATFLVFLPKLEDVDAEKAKALEAIKTGTERILLVDDEEALADLGKEILETLGYRVTAMTSSLDALETFRARPDAFDLVISDMTMPVLTGKKLAEAIISLRPDMPIILSTGYSDLVNEKQAKEAGIREFVMKPYEIRTLATVVRKALEKK